MKDMLIGKKIIAITKYNDLVTITLDGGVILDVRPEYIFDDYEGLKMEVSVVEKKHFGYVEGEL